MVVREEDTIRDLIRDTFQVGWRGRLGLVGVSCSGWPSVDLVVWLPEFVATMLFAAGFCFARRCFFFFFTGGARAVGNHNSVLADFRGPPLSGMMN